ncbi:MAG: hypothetical protein IAE79_11065 [Anaerolinea sp.]|nr:hypothetical protein [Anaerolinea sp.]
MTTIKATDKNATAFLAEQAHVYTGAAAAAFIAGGIGALTLGLMTTGAVISEGLSNFLNWWNPAGPLTGKTGISILAWLISWAILNHLWKDKDADLAKAFTITLILIGLGFVMTFPPVFEAFE